MFKQKRHESVYQDKPLDLRLVLRDLVEEKRLSKKDMDDLLLMPRNRQQASMHPLIYIADQGFDDLSRQGKALDLDALTEWLGVKAEQPVYRIDPLKIDLSAITQVMSYAFTQRHRILAVEVNATEVTIASAEPFVNRWEQDLEHVLRKTINRVIANPKDIERHSSEFYSLSNSITKANVGNDGSVGISNLEQMLELGQLKDPDANDQHIVNIVDWLLQYAFEQRASDIHIEPRRTKGLMRFRIDGVLYDVYEFPMQVLAAVTSRIKILGRMNVAEKRRPQDGRLKTKSLQGIEVELRLSTLPTAFGEKLVMRIFDPDVLLKSFVELGLTGDNFKRWGDMMSQPNGIVLITGPTGSGKTTTLYSTLKQLATREVNVCTIEDPIEMVESSFNQMQVQENIDLTFASGVRSLLRQDPDIIMIGEIRDLDTAEMAIQAALTGHLVFSTLHTNDAPTAVTRLMDLGVPGYLIKATVLGVMAQRLVRTLCPHCKQEDEISSEDWKILTTPWKASKPASVFTPKGCLECRQTGYIGRQGVYEIMPLSEVIKDQIVDDSDLSKLRGQAYKEGMKTLRLSGAQKVASGITTMAEVLRVTPRSEKV